jgi:hypothetical protein
MKFMPGKNRLRAHSFNGSVHPLNTEDAEQVYNELVNNSHGGRYP